MVHLVEIAEPSRRDRGKVRQYAHIHPIYDLRSACLCVCVCVQSIQVWVGIENAINFRKLLTCSDFSCFTSIGKR